MVESALGATTVKKGRGKAAASGGGEDDGLPPPSDADSEPDVEAEIDVSKFQKKARGGRAASGSTTGAKRKAPARGGKAAPKKRKS